MYRRKKIGLIKHSKEALGRIYDIVKKHFKIIVFRPKEPWPIKYQVISLL